MQSMANRNSIDEDEKSESTTLVHGLSAARIKSAASFPPDSPKIRHLEPVQSKSAPQSSMPRSDEFVKASVAVMPAVPVASSGMAGPYHLALEIASGGMATVYLAVHGLEGFQNTVAVKRIHPHLAKDKQFVDMFVDEAHIAARINHPYVCRVFDFGKAGDSYYIAMEFLRGEPLSRVFKTLTPERIANPRHPAIIGRIVANLAEGLHAAHTLKDTNGQCLDVVHRDVTPQNLFVLCDGTVRVTDFGIARARVRSHQTEGGRIKGKLSYMSPEQLNQQSMDCRSDIWSLGVVMWELLTGRRLFRASSEGETVLSVLSRPIPAPSRFAGGVPRQLDAIVLRALSRDPELRYSSARELVRALEGFLAASGDTVPTMDLADWVEELFPGAATRSDGLVQLAHAVIPPERRTSMRAPTLPVVAEPTSAHERRATLAQRAQVGKLQLPSIEPHSELRIGRALLITLALVAGVVGTIAYSRLAGHQAEAPRVEVQQPKATVAAETKPSPVVEAPPIARAPIAAPPVVAPPSTTKVVPTAPAVAASPATGARRATAATSAAAPASALDRNGSVQLLTKNGRAEVYLAGRMVGVTPLTLDLPAGNTALLLKPVAGGESRTVNVTIQTGATSFITVPLTVAAPAASN